MSGLNSQVDFIIIGAQKSGTTSLSYHLMQHPMVCFCSNKEPDFFDKLDWDKNVSSYHALYRPDNNEQKWGEGSTRYTMMPEVLGTEDRIYAYNPKMKLIYLMRDPVERAISQYAHRLVRKRVLSSLEEELEVHPSYLNRSKYHLQIMPYINRFGRDLVYINTFEQFIMNPQLVMTEVAQFIGIDASFYNSNYAFERKNQSAKRKILPDFGKSALFKPIKQIGHKLPKGVRDTLLNLLGNSIDSKPDFPAQIKSDFYQQTLSDRAQIEQLLQRELVEWKRY